MWRPSSVERREGENSPENATNSAITNLENKEAVSDTPSTVSEAKCHISRAICGTTGFLVDLGRVCTSLVLKITGGLFKFAKTAIEKRGKMTWKDGMTIANEMFSFDAKKEKK